MAFTEWCSSTFEYSEENIFNFDDVATDFCVSKVIETFEFIAFDSITFKFTTIPLPDEPFDCDSVSNDLKKRFLSSLRERELRPQKAYVRQNTDVERIKARIEPKKRTTPKKSQLRQKISSTNIDSSCSMPAHSKRTLSEPLEQMSVGNTRRLDEELIEKEGKISETGETENIKSPLSKNSDDCQVHQTTEDQTSPYSQPQKTQPIRDEDSHDKIQEPQKSSPLRSRSKSESRSHHQPRSVSSSNLHLELKLKTSKTPEQTPETGSGRTTPVLEIQENPPRLNAPKRKKSAKHGYKEPSIAKIVLSSSINEAEKDESEASCSASDVQNGTAETLSDEDLKSPSLAGSPLMSQLSRDRSSASELSIPTTLSTKSGSKQKDKGLLDSASGQEKDPQMSIKKKFTQLLNSHTGTRSNSKKNKRAKMPFTTVGPEFFSSAGCSHYNLEPQPALKAFDSEMSVPESTMKLFESIKSIPITTISSFAKVFKMVDEGQMECEFFDVEGLSETDILRLLPLYLKKAKLFTLPPAFNSTQRSNVTKAILQEVNDGRMEESVQTLSLLISSLTTTNRIQLRYLIDIFRTMLKNDDADENIVKMHRKKVSEFLAPAVFTELPTLSASLIEDFKKDPTTLPEIVQCLIGNFDAAFRDDIRLSRDGLVLAATPDALLWLLSNDVYTKEFEPDYWTHFIYTYTLFFCCTNCDETPHSLLARKILQIDINANDFIQQLITVHKNEIQEAGSLEELQNYQSTPKKPQRKSTVKISLDSTGQWVSSLLDSAMNDGTFEKVSSKSRSSVLRKYSPAAIADCISSIVKGLLVSLEPGDLLYTTKRLVVVLQLRDMLYNFGYVFRSESFRKGDSLSLALKTAKEAEGKGNKDALYGIVCRLNEDEVYHTFPEMKRWFRGIKDQFTTEVSSLSSSGYSQSEGGIPSLDAALLALRFADAEAPTFVPLARPAVNFVKMRRIALILEHFLTSSKMCQGNLLTQSKKAHDESLREALIGIHFEEEEGKKLRRGHGGKGFKSKSIDKSATLKDKKLKRKE